MEARPRPTSGVRPLPSSVPPPSGTSPVPNAPSLLPGAFTAALRAGALAAVATWAVVVLPALVGWVAAPESSVGWFSAVSVASGIWFLGHGQSIGAGGVPVSLTPLLLLGVNVVIAWRWARRVASTQRTAVGQGAWSSVALRGVVPGFLVGYLVVAGVVALLTLGGAATPGAAAVPGALLVPLSALGLTLLRPDDEESPAFVRTAFRRGPTWLPTVWRLGWRGAAALAALGLGVSVLRIVLTFPAVLAISGDYGVNPGELLVVSLAQLTLLGNAAVWALSYLAGPGFAVALGSTVSPAAAAPGLLPLVPVLGAMPQSADYPPIMYAVLLLPVAAGALIGWGVDRELEFFGNVRARVTARVVGALLAVVVVGGVAALGNGSIGVDRLSAVGVPIGAFAVALALEVVAGALLWLGATMLREWQATRATTSTSDGTGDAADADDGSDDGSDDAPDDRDADEADDEVPPGDDVSVSLVDEARGR
ncbi:MAG: hypothetical protein JWP82_2048 [Humibacillus sp.]|nr:hypothetical protein [Humibacillus sp.]